MGGYFSAGNFKNFIFKKNNIKNARKTCTTYYKQKLRKSGPPNLKHYKSSNFPKESLEKPTYLGVFQIKLMDRRWY